MGGADGYGPSERMWCVERPLVTLQDMWLSVADPVERPPRPSDTSVIGNLGVVRRPSRARPAPAALSICSITSSTAVVTFELERREVACTPVYSIGSARYIKKK